VEQEIVEQQERERAQQKENVMKALTKQLSQGRLGPKEADTSSVEVEVADTKALTHVKRIGGPAGRKQRFVSAFSHFAVWSDIHFLFWLL
jgi:hypothetical protein